MSNHNVHVSKHPLVAHKMSLLRNKDIKNKQVRELVSEIATIVGIEATASLTTTQTGKVGNTRADGNL